MYALCKMKAAKTLVVEGSSTGYFVWLENQREARLVRQRDYMLSLAAHSCAASCIIDI